MPEKTIILTHCGKLGDMLYCLPIASWLMKTRGVKTHMVLPKCFPPFRYVEALLRQQECISDVSFVDHECNWSGHAGQPYKFDPAKFGIQGEYYNLGFRGYPNKFVTPFVAEEHGFDYDRDFTLNLEPNPFMDNGNVFRSEQPEVGHAAPHAEIYPIPCDLLWLGRALAGAKERHLWYSGPAAMMFLARVPFHLHYVQGHPPRYIYLPNNEFGGALITNVFNAAPDRK